MTSDPSLVIAAMRRSNELEILEQVMMKKNLRVPLCVVFLLFFPLRFHRVFTCILEVIFWKSHVQVDGRTRSATHVLSFPWKGCCSVVKAKTSSDAAPDGDC